MVRGRSSVGGEVGSAASSMADDGCSSGRGYDEAETGKGGGHAVAGQVMRRMVGGVPGRVADQARDVYADEGEVVKIQAPCPNACARRVSCRFTTCGFSSLHVM